MRRMEKEKKEWAEDLEDIRVRLRDKYYRNDLYLDVECGFGTTEPEVVTIHALYLPPEERGKGIGTAVMKELIEECQKAGFFAIQLEAFPKVEDEDGMSGEEIKDLVHWYESLGFELDDPSVLEEIDDEEKYIYNDFTNEGWSVSRLWLALDLVEWWENGGRGDQ